MTSRPVTPTRLTAGVSSPRPARACTKRLRSLAALWLSLACLGAACGGDDAPSTNAREPDSGEPDGGTTPDKDAGNTTPVKHKDAGTKLIDSGRPDSGRDAGKDAAVSVVVDSGPGDVETDPGPPPENWLCAAALWADGYCDCSCGAADSDCVGQSCTDPGCIAASCDACYTAELAWNSCEPAPDPSDWSCDVLAQTDTYCDCGCSVPDDACGGSGCSEPACWRGACDFRHDAQGTLLQESRPPLSWKCPSAAWGGGDGCDCGCGAEDPDCVSSHNCTTALCNDTECNICHDSSGRTVPCDDSLDSWSCDPQRFGSGDGCDCGCGVADPDCADQGCTAYGCRAAACARCTDSSYANDRLVGCGSTKTWTCDLSHYGTGDGCDCGCGVADPDCAQDAGCTEAGCQQAACDYCHTGAAAESHADSFADYQICSPGWTCGTASDDAWANDECDCGCGKPDPNCRSKQLLSCTDPGCATATCDFCNSAGTRAVCAGPKWSAQGTCTARGYGLDGKCDCGCGALDPDCGDNAGCSAAYCAGEGCEVCHGSSTRLATCYVWYCAAEAYGDGKCDCGCGAPDPDCSGLGCSEPGCRGDMDVCKPDGCHDQFGRQVACP